jgi:hypothetical protein
MSQHEDEMVKKIDAVGWLLLMLALCVPLFVATAYCGYYVASAVPATTTMIPHVGAKLIALGDFSALRP